MDITLVCNECGQQISGSVINLGSSVEIQVYPCSCWDKCSWCEFNPDLDYEEDGESS